MFPIKSIEVQKGKNLILWEIEKHTVVSKVAAPHSPQD